MVRKSERKIPFVVSKAMVKYIVKMRNRRIQIGFIWLRIWTTGSCKHGNQQPLKGEGGSS
jgi:hypothetical protein